jgi:hypothetical protein
MNSGEKKGRVGKKGKKKNGEWEDNIYVEIVNTFNWFKYIYIYIYKII